LEDIRKESERRREEIKRINGETDVKQTKG
jgi:hypothetical protein